MKNNKLLLVVQSAVLVALVLAFQQLRLVMGNNLASTIVIGSLVNLVLVVAAGTVGWRGSIAVAVLSPVVAFLQGHLALPVLIPFVVVGNAMIAVVFELIERKKNTYPRLWLGVAVSSVAKFITLYCLVVLLFVNVILPGMGLPAQKAGALATALSLSFGWSQLVTAAVGGSVAVLVLKALRRAFDKSGANGAS